MNILITVIVLSVIVLAIIPFFVKSMSSKMKEIGAYAQGIGAFIVAIATLIAAF